MRRGRRGFGLSGLVGGVFGLAEASGCGGMHYGRVVFELGRAKDPFGWFSVVVITVTTAAATAAFRVTVRVTFVVTLLLGIFHPVFC